MTRARIGKKVPPSFSLDVEFDVPAGVTALYGPKGSGKTLILKTLAGFTRPDSGRILQDDVLLFDAEARVQVPSRRRGYVYVPTEGALFPHLTVRQNLAFSATGARLERHRQVGEMLERFGLAEAGLRRPAEIAAECRLRAALARALLAAPKLLLLDEPDLSEKLFAQLREYFAGPVLIATHDLDLAAALADQMLVLSAGRILRRGKPHEILDQPESAEVARLLGNPNVFECTIAALDPGRNISRLQVETAAGEFEVSGPYLPGHFRGDQVWIAIRPEHVRVHPAGAAAAANARPAQLVRVSRRARSVRLEFSGGVFAELSAEGYAGQKDNKGWQVEFPPEALRVL